MNFDAKSFSIDSTLELIADHWAADTPDSVLFRGADPSDRVTLRAGLLDAANNPQIISAIENALIDEYELVVTTNNVAGRVRGRDPSSLILDSYFTKLYARKIAQQPGVFVEVQPGQQSAIVPSDNTAVGNFSASQIARDAIASVGLTLSWEVRDYEILAPTYQASGRVIDILRQLVAPWMLVDPFKVDILLQGSTIVVKHRSLPSQALVPQYSFEFTALRRSSLTVRKRRLRKIGKVTLTGAKDAASLGLTVNDPAKVAAGEGVFSGSEVSVVVSNEAFDDGGNLVSLVTTVETYRMPDRILLRTVKSTYTQGVGAVLTLSTRETIINAWESSIYDVNGPANSPKQLKQSIFREGIDETDSEELFRTLSQEFAEYQYGDLGFKTGETVLKQKFNLDTKIMENDTLTVKTLHDTGALLAEEITERYNWNTDKQFWVIAARDSATSGGHRPGGPGRGRSKAGTENVAGGGGGTATNLVLERTFSTDPDAVPVSYANENLSMADLQFIMDMFAATVNMKEYEFAFGGVAMPWLRRGMIVQFMNIPADEGLLLTFPPAMVTEIRTSYVETGGNPAYRMECRAFGWSTS